MRLMIIVALVVFLAGPALSQELGVQAPLKTPPSGPVNIPSPVRQGGDTIASATVIPALPYDDSGTTVGYTDDYQSTCFFAGGAPDVVYAYTPSTNRTIGISLCGSTYDTGLYVYDSGLTEIACNDDFCGLQSQLEGVYVVAGNVYYIVVDGYNSASGAYVIDVYDYCDCCFLECPAGGTPEGEPPLVPDYVDNWNGGCNTPGFPFQVLGDGDQNHELILCGVSGWYLSNGSQYRDTDWYILHAGDSPIEMTMDAEYATYFFELGPQDCNTVAVIQQVTGGRCSEASMTISGYAPGAPVWFWAGPTVFASPDGEDAYDYLVWIDYGPVPTESTTWSTMKALFD